MPQTAARTDPHPDASLYAALTAAAMREPAGPSPIELVQALSAATRGFGHALDQASEDLADLDEALPPRLRHRLRGMLVRLEDAAARQQQAAAALARHLARSPR